MKTKKYYLLAFMTLCFISAVYESLFYWYEQEPSELLLNLSSILSFLFFIIWVDADSKDQTGKVYRPYDFGFLVFLFWLPYLPYYFWRTRGVFGLVKFGGLMSLFFLGYIAQELIYFVH